MKSGVDKIKKAIFITYDKFPDKDAGAVRIHMLANMLRDKGYSVLVISMGPYTRNKVLCIDEIKYKSYRFKRNSVLSKLTAYFMFPIRLYIDLKKYKCDVCIHTQVRKSVLNILKSYCKKKKKVIVYDAVEWFSPEQFINGKNSNTYKLNNSYNRKLIDQNHRVIAISKYLFTHFENRNINVVNIPVVLDVKNTNHIKQNNVKRIKILYAGSPGKKDYLDVIIHALLKLNKDELKRIEFNIVGCTKENLISVCGVEANDIDVLADSLIIKGRMSRDKVMKEYETTHFSILIRSQDQRYAKAGFPTKFVESLSLSTPVICNLTSDLGDYVLDGVNGIIVENESEEACYEAFKRVLSINEEQLVNMQIKASNIALEKFDYRKYTEKFINFIESVE